MNNYIMKFGPSPFTYELVMNYLSISGLEALSTFSITRHVEDAISLGFRHFEIGLDIFQTFPIPILEEELIKLHELKIRENISYSAHLPFFSLDLAVSNEFIREGSKNALVNSFRSVKKIERDIECFVIHPTGENTSEILKFIANSQVESMAIEIFKQNAIQTIQAFIQETGIDPKKVAIENLEFPLIPTIDIIKETRTRFCLDTAHLLGGMAGSWDLYEVLTDYYDLISEIHLQEYDYKNPMNDHAALGRFNQIPMDFFKFLEDKKFDAPVIFELPRPEIQESCEYLKKVHPYLTGIPNISEKNEKVISFLDKNSSKM